MVVKTKFNPDQFVWILHKNKARQFKVNSINIGFNTSLQLVNKYFIHIDTYDTIVINEENCFEAKEDLIKSLDYEDTNMDNC